MIKRILKKIFTAICLMAIIFIAFLVFRTIYINNSKSIEEKAYDSAVSVCEKDVLNSTNPYFKEYNPQYIKWISEDTIEVKVIYNTYQNGVEKEVEYRVYVYIDDERCYPDIPERILN